MAYLNECFEAGRLLPVLDGPYTLDQAPDAFRRFGAGMHQGKVVIAM
jgi:NADPH:quinone reductase-like Zn-dependent oxidoreductase